VSRKTNRQAKNGARASIDTILVPVDFSDCSLQGLNYAIAFAEKFAAAKIILLDAIEIAYPYNADGYAMYDLTALIKAAQKDGERQMRQFVERAKFGRVPFETVVKTGSPIDAVSTIVKDRNVDLIITSTHGRTGINHVLVGSVAEKIVRHAPCPVLVVPSHPDVRKAHLSRRARPVQRAKRATGRRTLQPIEMFTRKYRKLGVNPFPERRKTNKFRESHLLNK
jgi:universal stress protein A